MWRLLLSFVFVIGLRAQPAPAQVSLTAITGAIGGAVEAIQVGKYVYASYNNQTGQSAGLAIFDGTNAAAPLLLGQVTVAETTARNVAVTEDGNTAFLIPYDPAPGVVIAINATDKTNPIVASRKTLNSGENHLYWCVFYRAPNGTPFLLASLDNASHGLVALNVGDPANMIRTAVVNIGSLAITLTDFATSGTSWCGCMGTNAVGVTVVGGSLANLTAGSPSISVTGAYTDGTYTNCKGGAFDPVSNIYYATASGVSGAAVLSVNASNFTLIQAIALANITEPRHAVLNGGTLYIPSQASSKIDRITGLAGAMVEQSALTFTTQNAVAPGVGRAITISGSYGWIAFDGTSSAQLGVASVPSPGSVSSGLLGSGVFLK